FLLLWSQNDAWPPANLAAPDWSLGGIGLALLATSLLPLALAIWSMRHRRAGLLATGLAACALLGTAWGVMSWQALGVNGFAPRQMSFNAMLAALFAFQLLHIAIGVVLLLFGAVRALVAGFAAGMHRLMRIVAVFWLYATIITLVSVALVRLLPDWGPAGTSSYRATAPRASSWRRPSGCSTSWPASWSWGWGAKTAGSRRWDPSVRSASRYG